MSVVATGADWPRNYGCQWWMLRYPSCFHEVVEEETNGPAWVVSSTWKYPSTVAATTQSDEFILDVGTDDGLLSTLDLNA